MSSCSQEGCALELRAPCLQPRAPYGTALTPLTMLLTDSPRSLWLSRLSGQAVLSVSLWLCWRYWCTVSHHVPKTRGQGRSKLQSLQPWDVQSLVSDWGM